MAKRKLPKTIIKAHQIGGELAAYENNPYYSGTNFYQSPDGESLIQPSDEFLIRRGGVQALNIYRECLYDGNTQSAFRKLVQEITARKLKVIPFSDSAGDEFIATFVETILDSLPMDEVYSGLAESLVTGVSYAEVLWQDGINGIVPSDIKIRDQRQFTFIKEPKKSGYGLRIRNHIADWPGTIVPAKKIIVSRYNVTNSGDPYGQGLGRILHPLISFTRRALENYLLYSDRYASPTAVGEVPSTAIKEEVDAFYDHISQLSSEMALVLPPGFKLTFVNPTSSPQLFIDLVNHLEKTINMLIISENEVGVAEAGSRASSEVANTVRVTRAAELAQRISWDIQNSLIRWIVDLNFGEDVQCPKIERSFDILTSNLTVQDLVSLKENFGLLPSKNWIESQFSVELEELPPEPERDLAGIFGTV